MQGKQKAMTTHRQPSRFNNFALMLSPRWKKRRVFDASGEVAKLVAWLTPDVKLATSLPLVQRHHANAR
jgi:hypothetical protein